MPRCLTPLPRDGKLALLPRMDKPSETSPPQQVSRPRALGLVLTANFAAWAVIIILASWVLSGCGTGDYSDEAARSARIDFIETQHTLDLEREAR